jgi:putative phosphoesterase
VISTEEGGIARRSIELRDGRLRLVVVADTHGRPHPESNALIAALSPHGIVHAGDIGDAGVLTALERIAPLFAVRGNIDAHALQVPDTMTLDVTAAGRAVLRLLVVHIGVVGPKLRAEVARLARREEARLVLCGHSHVPFIGNDRGIAVFNPGSVGPRRFQLPIVFGVMEVEPTGIRMRHVDCETGQDWQP